MGKSNPAMFLLPGYGQLKLADEAFLAPGRRAAREQERGLRDQQQVQERALAQSQKVQRENEEAYNRANRKQPELGSLLTDAKAQASSGIASTLLTGPLGIERKNLQLSPPKTLLGA